MTLPMSRGDAAPVSVMAWSTSARSSASVNCCGTNSETTAMAASSWATRFSRPPARKSSSDSWRTLSSRVRTPIISSSVSARPRVVSFSVFWTAASTMRSESRRMALLDFIAAFNSSSSRSRRDTGWHLGAGCAFSNEPRTRRRREQVSLALNLTRDLLALCFLALALHARLLIVLTATGLGKDAALLNLLVETAQGTLEALVFTHTDFCQSGNHLLRGSLAINGLTSPSEKCAQTAHEQGARSVARESRYCLAEARVAAAPPAASATEPLANLYLGAPWRALRDGGPT